MNQEIPFLGVDAFEEAERVPLQALRQKLIERYADAYNGNFSNWAWAVSALPEHPCTELNLNESAVRAGSPIPPNTSMQRQWTNALMQLHPWRKGPFQLDGITLNTEWRSDWKWQRIQKAIHSFHGKRLLDIGAGNGYYLFRALGVGARCAIGIDPMLLYAMQFEAITRFTGPLPACILPMGIEEFQSAGSMLGHFDIVFSLGLLYHRKVPAQHLRDLRSWLANKGTLLLETLVYPGDDPFWFTPPGRYANMRNVWQLPTLPALTDALHEAGYSGVETVDVSSTTIREQRRTPWMQFHSLANSLDRNNTGYTIEGHPAPQRALLKAQKV